MTIHKLYNDEIELEFDDRRHVYKFNGDKIPSVTGVTGMIDKSGPLMWWAVKQAVDFIQEAYETGDFDRAMGDELTEPDFWKDATRAHVRSSKKATDIGSLAHKWIEDYLASKHKGESLELPVNPQLRSTIDSFLEWESEHELVTHETEFKVFSRDHLYAGTCDFDGYVGKQRCIVDWKTGKAVYPEHCLQTAAYQHAREEELGIKYDGRWVVVLPKDGGKIKAKFMYSEEEYLNDLDGFLGALALHRRIKGF